MGILAKFSNFRRWRRLRLVVAICVSVHFVYRFVALLHPRDSASARALSAIGSIESSELMDTACELDGSGDLSGHYPHL